MLVILTFIQLPAQEESELLSLLWKLDEEMVTSLHKTIRSASMSGSKPCRKMINKELACRHGVSFCWGKSGLILTLISLKFDQNSLIWSMDHFGSDNSYGTPSSLGSTVIVEGSIDVTTCPSHNSWQVCKPVNGWWKTEEIVGPFAAERCGWWGDGQTRGGVQKQQTKRNSRRI